MTRSLVATTSAQNLQPLGTGGQLAIGAAEALHALILRELTPAHAALLAEPQPNAARGEVDWYAEGDGEAVPLPRLPPEAAAPVRAELDRLTDDIRTVSARFRDAPAESDRFLAAMLDLALRIPDADAIRVRSGKPVLVGWGHQRTGTEAGPAAVLGHVRAPPAPMAILPPPVLPDAAGGPRLWPWLGALALSLLLLAGSLWLLWHPPLAAEPAACRLETAGLDALDAWRDVNGRNAALQAELAALVDDAGRRRLQCRPPAQAAAAPPPSPPPSRDAERAQRRGGKTGKLQIILAWDDRNDLDLHVLCPDQEHIFFGHRRGCGGVLDVDANANTRNTTSTPVENVYWAEPGPGTYKVVVDPFAMPFGAESSFRVTVRQEGQPDRVVEGTAVQGQRVAPVLDVQVPAAGEPP